MQSTHQLLATSTKIPSSILPHELVLDVFQIWSEPSTRSAPSDLQAHRHLI